VREASLDFGDKNANKAISHPANTYGDGKTGVHIAQANFQRAGQADRPAEFDA
jgi:hypothetical protein